MDRKRQAILYFIAAALFAVAGTISFAREGLSIKTAVAVIFTVSLIIWGLKSGRAGE